MNQINKSLKIQKDFKKAIQQGRGLAFLIASNHSDIDFSSIIIDACINNYAYDGQCENSRAFYLKAIVDISPNKSQIGEAIKKALFLETEHSWNLTQLFDLCRLLAKDGDDEAKQMMYLRFELKPIPYSDWIGIDCLLELDGTFALLKIAEILSTRISNQDEEQLPDDSLIRVYQNTYPEQDAAMLLEKAASKNNKIRTYLNHIQQQNNSQENYTAHKQQLKQNIGELGFWLYESTPEEINNKIWSQDELNSLGELRLSLEHLPYKLSANLKNIFEQHPHPFGAAGLIKFLNQLKRNDHREYKALHALSHFRSPFVRAFIMNKIESTKNPGAYIHYLGNNLLACDYDYLLRWAKKVRNPDKIEALINGIVELHQKNNNFLLTQGVEILLVLYRKTNCGICRSSVINYLIEQNVMPKNIEREIAHDSYRINDV